MQPLTLLYERFAIEVLQACRRVGAPAELLGLSWDQLHVIMEPPWHVAWSGANWRNCARWGWMRRALPKGQSYVSLLTDLDAGGCAKSRKAMIVGQPTCSLRRCRAGAPK